MHCTFVTMKTVTPATIAQIEDETARTLAGQSSPIKSQGTVFIPMPKAKMNRLANTTGNHPTPAVIA